MERGDSKFSKVELQIPKAPLHEKRGCVEDQTAFIHQQKEFKFVLLILIINNVQICLINCIYISNLFWYWLQVLIHISYRRWHQCSSLSYKWKLVLTVGRDIHVMQTMKLTTILNGMIINHLWTYHQFSCQWGPPSNLLSSVTRIIKLYYVITKLNVSWTTAKLKGFLFGLIPDRGLDDQ